MSNNYVGFASAALQMGYSATIKPLSRSISNIRLSDGSTLPDLQLQIVVEERFEDELDVTENPVETGAAISDHAFKMPNELVLHLGWSNSPSVASTINNPQSAINTIETTLASTSLGAQLAAAGINAATLLQSGLNGANVDQMASVYDSLLQIQDNRALFDVQTGKRLLTDMVARSIHVDNDYRTENALFIRLTCRHVILVNTETVTLPASLQANEQKTASIVNKGTAQLVQK